MRQSPVMKALSELAIIILGVLIALLAESAWNDYRDRAEGRKYLERLAVESRENLKLLQLDRSWARYACTSAQEALSSLRDPDNANDPSAFLRSVVLAALYSNPRYQRVTHDDLVGTGGLSLIDDAILRARIVAAYTDFFESLDAWRPPKDGPLRTAMLRTLPGEFIKQVAVECLDTQNIDAGEITIKSCNTAPASPPADDLLRAISTTPDIEGYLRERAWQTCEFEGDMSVATELLEELVAVLETAMR